MAGGTKDYGLFGCRDVDLKITRHSPASLRQSLADDALARPTFEHGTEGMNSYICAGCRQRLGRIKVERIVQWRSRASFISLNGPTKPQRITEELARDELLNLAGDLSSRKDRRPFTLPEVKKQLPRPPGHTNPGDMLEVLFEQTLKERTPAEAPSQPVSSLGPYKNAETLKRMVEDSNCSVVETWQFFVDTFGPDAESIGTPERRLYPSYLAERSRTLMKRIIHAKSKDNPSPSLPSVTEISTIYSQLGLLHGGEWVQSMTDLLAQISKSSTPQSKAEAILDLIRSWNVVCRKRRSGEGSVEISSPLDWSQIPPVSRRLLEQAYKVNGINGCFNVLTPAFPPRFLIGLPLVIFGSFSILTKEQGRDEALQNASPLISAFGNMIRLCRIGHDQLCASTAGDSAKLIAKLIKEDWVRLHHYASQLEPRKGAPILPPPVVRMNYSFVQRRLRDAFAKRDARLVDQLWGEAAALPVQKEQATPEIETEPQAHISTSSTLTAGLCNYFILVYMGLRQPDRAIDVWNHMISKEISPNLLTWNHMLMGCKASRDAKALEDVWNKMLKLRIVPDIHCWTTLVSGLMDCGRDDHAVQALEHMGRTWISKAKRQSKTIGTKELKQIDDVDGAIKPTIELVNAALAGLLRKHKPDAAYRVLSWASALGIEADAITYNTLLRPLIREGRTQEAMKLLQQMQEAGIPADVATFTTILDETFRASDQHSPEEQKAIITDLFTEMEAAGVKANLHTYGKIIYQLLQSSSQDLTAVNTVLERMSVQGLQPSTYIFTILIEHYFAQDPPDLDAVRSLIDRAPLQPGGADHIFWDRVIEGYARVGDTVAAMRILGKVHKGSSRASWITLKTLLTALVENEEWEVARTLVRDALVDSGGPLRDEERGKEGQHRFWRLVRELGLLDA